MRRLEAQTYTEVAKLETNTMLRSLNAFQQAIMLVDVAARGWEILHANNALLQKLGAHKIDACAGTAPWTSHDDSCCSVDPIQC